MELKKEYGSFKSWLDHYHPKTKDEWTKLFKKTFKFTWWGRSSMNFC